jgi:hypothetical protein
MRSPGSLPASSKAGYMIRTARDSREVNIRLIQALPPVDRREVTLTQCAHADRKPITHATEAYSVTSHTSTLSLV